MSADEIIEYLELQRAYAHKFNNKQIISITNVSLKLIKKQQKEIKNMAEKTSELIDGYEEEILEKNNYIFQLENEREALHKLIDEEMG